MWDMRTQEFWRSTSWDKASELIDQGGWLDLYVSLPSRMPHVLITTVALLNTKDLRKRANRLRCDVRPPREQTYVRTF